MDQDTRRRALFAMARMEVLAGFICIGIIAIVFIALMSRPVVSKREVELWWACWMPHLVVFFWACLAAAYPLSKILIYYGIPKFLTFGYQIGKVAPTTCAESLELEGPNGLPCSLARFGDWVHRVTSGDGSWHLDEFESLWKEKLVEMVVLVLVLLAMFVFFWWTGRRDIKKMEREDAETALGRSKD